MVGMVTGRETIPMSRFPVRLPADVDTQLVGAGCLSCANLIDLVEGICLGFPQGIPEAIRQDRVRHDQPFPGDGGFRFTPVPRPNGDLP